MNLLCATLDRIDDELDGKVIAVAGGRVLVERLGSLLSDSRHVRRSEDLNRPSANLQLRCSEMKAPRDDELIQHVHRVRGAAAKEERPAIGFGQERPRQVEQHGRPFQVGFQRRDVVVGRRFQFFFDLVQVLRGP